ncbi:MAG TPA: hypothetical protein VM534_08125, partial [Thermoanaerobaculia bacterium]|nr:hypothetical protein [Thermoanaerobaculia bacterium]
MTETSFSRGALLLQWPILFGLVLTLLRLFVLVLYGAYPVGTREITGLLFGLAGQIGFGVLLALPLEWTRNSRARWFVYALVVPIVFLNVAAFH